MRNIKIKKMKKEETDRGIKKKKTIKMKKL
jgi:hypothetical protein